MTVSPDLDRRFRDAAATLGLIDVGFDVVDSPIGELLVAASDRGLAAISFDPDPGERARAARPHRRPARPPLAAKRRRRAPRARRVLRGPPPRLRPPARPPRAAAVHDLRPRRARARPVRRDDDVRRARAARRPPARGARRRDGDEPQPHPDRPPVPSRRRRDGRPHRLRGRARPQEHAARARGRPLTSPRACDTRRHMLCDRSTGRKLSA